MSSTFFPERQFLDPERAGPAGAESAGHSDAMITLIFDGLDLTGRHVMPIFYRCDAASPYLLTHLSGAVAANLGCRPEDLTGKPRFALDGDYRNEGAPLPDRLKRLFARGVHVGECQLRHRDGHLRRFRDEMRLLRDENGTPMQIAGCLTALEK